MKLIKENIKDILNRIDEFLNYHSINRSDFTSYSDFMEFAANDILDKEVDDLTSEEFNVIRDTWEDLDSNLSYKAKLARYAQTNEIDEKLENNEISDFFNKAKKLGVKNLGELKRLLNEPEATGKTEKEKIDSYYKEANPEDKDLNEDTSMTSKTVDNSKIDFDIKDNGDFTFKINGKEYKGHTDKPEEMSKDMKEFGFDLTEPIKENIVKSIEPLDADVDKEVESTFASDDKSFPYRMLSRLQSDCRYILGALKDNSKDGKLDLETINKFLWFNNIDKQIAFMKGIYERLDEKPEWITLEQIEDYGNQMKELIRTESIKEDLDLEHLEDGPKTENTGIAQMLIDAINGEWDTIKLYNDIMVNAEAYGYEDISNVIRDITNEENTHIGQLEKALETVSPNICSINQGEQEAENQLTDVTDVNELETYENN